MDRQAQLELLNRLELKHRADCAQHRQKLAAERKTLEEERADIIGCQEEEEELFGDIGKLDSMELLLRQRVEIIDLTLKHIGEKETLLTKLDFPTN